MINFRKFATLWLTPLVAVLLLLLKVPGIEKFVKDLNPNAIWYAAGFLVASTLFTHYVTVFSPFKKYERWAKNRWSILDIISKPLVDKYANQGYELRINIMIAKRRLLFFLHPLPFKGKEYRKPTFWGRIFRVIWNYGNAGVHKKLKISTKQGVCGKSFTSADTVRGAEFVTGSVKFNFNKEQKKLTENLKFVASFHVFQDGNTAEQKSNEVVGVLNFESESEGSETLITDPTKRKQLYADIVTLANVCSKFL
jgi:hypothetical protein